AVDLVDQLVVHDQALAALGHRGREEGPGQQAQVGEQGVRGPAGVHLGPPLEEDGEDDHQGQRGQDAPGDPKDGLLVADAEIPLGQRPDQLATLPDLADGRDDAHLEPEQDVGRRLGGTRRYCGHAGARPPAPGRLGGLLTVPAIVPAASWPVNTYRDYGVLRRLRVPDTAPASWAWILARVDCQS